LESPYLVAMMESGPAVFYAPTATRITSAAQRVGEPPQPLPAEIRSLLSSQSTDFQVTPEQMPRDLPRSQLTTPLHIAGRSEVWMAAGGLSRQVEKYAYWVGLWKRGAAQPSVIYRGHRWTPLHVTVSRDGRRAASVDQYGDIHVWDTRSGERLFLAPAAPHQPLFDVAWSSTGTKLHFGKASYPARDFKVNHYGALEFEFDLAKRFVRKLASDERAPSPQHDTDGLELREKPEGFTLIDHRVSGDPEYFDGDVGPITCYQRVKSENPLLDETVVVGHLTGEVRFVRFAGSGSSIHAELPGHAGFITATSLSPDRKLLATSSSDGTLRIWKLEELQRVGDVDFKVRGNQVIEVPTGSESARQGIAKGDRILQFADTSYYESRESLLYGQFRPGQVVSLEMERHHSEQRYTIDRFRLQPSFGRAQPLLSLLLTKDNEWVLWTREGFYDASPHGDQHIGWHRNRTREEAAEFFAARQFRDVMFQPAVIDRVVKTWDVPQAIDEVDSRQKPLAADLRDEFVPQAAPPRIEIIEPRGAATESQEVQFVVSVHDTEGCRVEQVDFECNGRRPEATGGFEASAGNTRRFRQKLRLDPGDNEIHIVAEAVDVRTRATVRSAVQTVRIKCQVAPREKLPRMFVLAIGVSEYEHDDAIPNLQFCHRDAEDFAAAWKGQEGRQYREVQTRVLTNEQATTAKVLEAFDWLAKSVGAEDCVAILLSGHGIVDRGHYYLASHDADRESLRSSAVSYAQIRQLVEEDLRPQIVMLFVDTCHGGGVLGARGENQRFDGWSDALATVFASCLPHEVSLEHADWTNGALTEALLEALNQWRADANRDKRLTLAELDQYLSQRVAELTNQQQHPSAKRLLTLPSDFTIARQP
jgi:hypothetical protein